LAWGEKAGKRQYFEMEQGLVAGGFLFSEKIGNWIHFSSLSGTDFALLRAAHERNWGTLLALGIFYLDH